MNTKIGNHITRSFVNEILIVIFLKDGVGNNNVQTYTMSSLHFLKTELVVSSTRTPEHFLTTHARVAQVCTSHFALVMFGVVCPIAHQKHLFILDVSSRSSRSSS